MTASLYLFVGLVIIGGFVFLAARQKNRKTRFTILAVLTAGMASASETPLAFVVWLLLTVASLLKAFKKDLPT